MAEQQDTPVEIWLRADDTEAGFLPSVGFNCTALRVRRDRGWQSVLAEPPTWKVARECPSFYGSPLLGPYAYGVRDSTFQYRNRTYRLGPGGEGKPMHGVTRDHAWEVIDHVQGCDEAVLTAHLAIGGQDEQAAARLSEYPFPMDIQVTYTLRSRELLVEFLVRNTGCDILPFGVGLHPYFAIPLDSGSSLADVTVSGSMSRIVDGPWGQTNVRLGGHEQSRDAFAVRLDEYLARTRKARPFLDLFERSDSLDTHARETGPLWSLCDSKAELQVDISASADFCYVGQFSSAHRQVLSPVVSTNRPGVFELAEQRRETGLLELAPGSEWYGWCSLQVEDVERSE